MNNSGGGGDIMNKGKTMEKENNEYVTKTGTGTRGTIEQNQEQEEMEPGREQKEKRKKKNGNQENQKEQNKFFVDVSKDLESREMILNLLAQANRKEHGREIILKDLVLVALPKLTAKDIEKIQENCLTAMEKIEREWTEYNKKNSVDLTLDQFLVKKLGIV